MVQYIWYNTFPLFRFGQPKRSYNMLPCMFNPRCIQISNFLSHSFTWGSWASIYTEVSMNGGTPKLFIYNEQPYWNGWFRGTPLQETSIWFVYIINSLGPWGTTLKQTLQTNQSLAGTHQFCMFQILTQTRLTVSNSWSWCDRMGGHLALSNPVSIDH
jgi:hypothetical protein